MTSRTETESDVLTDVEAGRYLGGVPAGTLKQWRYLGRGPAFVRLSGRHVRYRRADLDAWLEANRVVPKGAA